MGKFQIRIKEVLSVVSKQEGLMLGQKKRVDIMLG